MTSEDLNAWCKSLIKIKNNRGPRTDPWGKPWVAGLRSERQLATETNWELEPRYEENQDMKRTIDLQHPLYHNNLIYGTISGDPQY